MVAATGSYSASAPLNAPAPWIMQMVAFQTLIGRRSFGSHRCRSYAPPTVTSGSANSGPAAGGTVS